MITLFPVKSPFAGALHRSSSPSPLSSASMSPEHYDSPPSPPRSLEDQVHEAYALEDIHLAKILLLRLKGIEVTSDDDPRIAAVQDEDFDFCFLPNGPLLNEQDEKALKELQDRERRRIEELRRVERMRQCERKWVEEKQRMREQRVAELRRRERKRQEEEEQRRRAVEEERRRATAHRGAHRSKPKAERKFVNYDHLLTTKPDRNPPFVYDIMVTGPSSFSPRKSATPSPSAAASTRHVFPAPTFDDSRAITFKDVLKSMEGQLFPPTDEERRVRRNVSATTTTSRSRTTSRLRQSRLLDVLLAEVEYSREEHRKRKGKSKGCGQSTRSQVCPACSASRSPLPSLSPTTSSSSPVSRTSSWISFRTSPSLSSSSSDLTTPSSSPMTCRTPWLTSRPRSWIPGTSLQDAPQPPASRPLLRHSCRAYNRLTTISVSECPLVVDMQMSSSMKSSPLSYEGRQRNSSRVRTTNNGTGVLVKRVSRIVEFAKGFQSAYVTAALFSVTVSYDGAEERHSIFSARKESGVVELPRNTQDLRPSGFRASVNEVKAFLTTTAAPAGTKHEDNAEILPPKFIPLTSPFPLTEPPRTVLPDPLPYKLHFKPIPPPIRSPFRYHANPDMHTVYPPACSSDVYMDSIAQLGWRIRAVGNPVHLRVKALKNSGWKKGLKWEPSARDTSKGSGKERLLALTYEGIGRSNLCYSSSMYG